MKKVLDDINVFCAVVAQGSLKQASVHLGVPHSTVSRRLDALENSLQLDLVKRTTREISVTARGATVIPRVCAACCLAGQLN